MRSTEEVGELVGNARGVDGGKACGQRETRSTKRAPGSGPDRRAHVPGTSRTASPESQGGTVHQLVEPREGSASEGGRFEPPEEGGARRGWGDVERVGREAGRQSAPPPRPHSSRERPSAAGPPNAHPASPPWKTRSSSKRCGGYWSPSTRACSSDFRTASGPAGRRTMPWMRSR